MPTILPYGLLIIVFVLVESILNRGNPGFADELPNVVVIVADDLGYADMSFLPQSPPDVTTPGIDRLAEHGTYFSNAYATAPICSPSRAGLITGRYQQRWGNYWYGQGGLPKSEQTIAHALNKLGYFTKKIGKTHLNGGEAQHPLDHGFDEFIGFIHHSWDYIRLSQNDLDAYKKRAGGKKLGILNVGPLTRGRDEKAGYESAFTTTIFTQEATKTIKTGARTGKPFFVQLEHNAVHMPTYITDARYAKRAGFEQQVWDRNAAKWEFPYWDPNDMTWGAWHKKWGHLGEVDPLGRKRYIANLLALDDSVTAILDTLKQTGLDKNTIVVFLSDNGGTINTYSNNTPLRGYKYMFGEGGIRVPLIISWPGRLAENVNSSVLASGLDVVPTILELVGATERPNHFDGISLVEVLRGKEDARGHDHLCWARGRGDDTWVVRKGPWKLIQTKGWTHANYQLDGQGLAMPAPEYEYPAGLQLFNLENDIGETNNVADENANVVTELKQIYKTWQTEMGKTNGNKKRQQKKTKQKTGVAPLSTQPGKLQLAGASEEPKPNIVFCMADDWSWPHAGILGDPVVKTPNFDRIAREGILFEHAFVSTPSCTPSRLSILSGQHHWRLKEGDSLGGSLREEFDVYTEMLQDDGYRIGRFGKGVWPSKHSFRNRDSFGERFRSFNQFLEGRKSGQPFCYWHGGQDPHRPYELNVGAKSGIVLSKIKVPACLPDNATVRGDVADYLWEVQRFDREVGEIVTRLDEIGELENTIIVVSGDNGMPFPRCKATLYDQGTRVPLAIRWGAKVKGDRTVSDFVNLCDLAPTFLEAAGLKAPKQMTGQSLMPILQSQESGQIDPQRTFAITGMEKHVYSYPARAMRTNDYLYIRNFNPEKWPTGEVVNHHPNYDFAETPWPTEPGAFSFNIDPSPSKQFLRQHVNEKSTNRFAGLAFLRHPKEELYDLAKDPDQLRNVAGAKLYEKVKEKLRQQLDSELVESEDPRLVANGNQQ